MFNECSYLNETLEALNSASSKAEIGRTKTIIVNDGSTDGSGNSVPHFSHLNISVINQTNQGRFRARASGIASVRTDWTLLLDARTRVTEGCIQFLRDQVRQNPERQAWNGHVIIDPNGTPYVLFWDFVTRIAWRAYYKDPILREVNSANIERFPRGTTLFAAKTSLLRDAIQNFKSSFSRLEYASDDTLLISNIADSTNIWYSERFSATYFGRTTFSTFVSHTFGRGTRFVDSYLRPGTRYFGVGVIALPGVPVLLALMVQFPKVAITLLPILIIAVLAQRVASLQSKLAFLKLLPVFSIVYYLGILRGVLMLLAKRAKVAR